MPKAKFVDFRAVKAALTMEQVLEHYGLLDQFKRSGDSLSGPCPIHKGSSPTQFRVSVSKNIWNCFSECKRGGNVLDFIVEMESVSIHAAALKAIEWFGIDAETTSANSEESDEQPPSPRKADPPLKATSPSKPSAQKQVTAQERNPPNKPLKFRLDKLEREHPYLSERGLELETIIDFGIGYCSKGMMADRIAIPIHSPEGHVVAYAGRIPGEPTDDNPKYKLPPGFRKSLELFNVDRAIKERADLPLVIVEGFFDCMKLHQLGWRKVVALMGSSMSTAQEEILRNYTGAHDHIIVLLDEDDAGRAGREDIAARISKFAYVKIHEFETEGEQPENVGLEQLEEITGGVA